jgi:hypothetical protein
MKQADSANCRCYFSHTAVSFDLVISYFEIEDIGDGQVTDRTLKA